MPLRRDERGGGTNADGSKSTMYCSHCFEAGGFTLPDISAQEMQARGKGKLKQVGLPAFAGWLFTRNIPKLARWKNSGSTSPKYSMVEAIGAGAPAYNPCSLKNSLALENELVHGLVAPLTGA